MQEAERVDPTKIVAKKGKVVAKSTGLKYQFQIMEQIGVPREDIHKFADPQQWLTYFPPFATVSRLFCSSSGELCAIARKIADSS